MEVKGYRGSSTLKKSNIQIDWTKETVQQLLLCSQDPIYFAEKHMKIVNVDKGLITIPLYDYQKDIITTVLNERFTVAECSRQSGKTTSITVFVLWYIIFNPNKTVAILANKGETAREILSRIQLAYEHLPKWLQQGVVEWNKGSFELENGSRVLAAATSSNNIRGYSVNCVDGETKITVKDKQTGFINILSIDELNQEIKMRNEAYGFVYITTCLDNGKKYIGIHRKSEQDGYLGSGKAFLRAVKKYGKERFQQKIIQFCYDEQELLDAERIVVEQYNAVESENFYNILPGGTKSPILHGQDNGFFGKKHSKETKMKISQTHKGKTYSDVEKKSRSLAMKNRWKDTEFRQRMSKRRPRPPLTEEEKKLLSDKLTGRKMSDQAKEKLSSHAKKRWKENNKEMMDMISKRDMSHVKTKEFREAASIRMRERNLANRDELSRRMSEYNRSKKNKRTNNANRNSNE